MNHIHFYSDVITFVAPEPVTISQFACLSTDIQQQASLAWAASGIVCVMKERALCVVSCVTFLFMCIFVPLLGCSVCGLIWVKNLMMGNLVKFLATVESFPPVVYLLISREAVKHITGWFIIYTRIFKNNFVMHSFFQFYLLNLLQFFSLWAHFCCSIKWCYGNDTTVSRNAVYIFTTFTN